MAVRNFRIGNDLVVLWAICNRDGSPYNLANKQVRLFVMNERGRKEVAPVLTALPDGTINNVIRWDFLGMEQRVTGLYTLSVEIFTDEDKKSIKKDYCEAFCLVGSSSLEDEDLADNISDGGELILSSSLDVIQLTIPRIEIGTNGNWIIDGIDTNVSALGGGPGLVNKIYDVLGFGKEYDPTSVIDTFNAYAINSLYGSIKDAEKNIQDAQKDIQDAQSSINTLEEDVEYLKTFGGGGSGGSSGGGSISQEQLIAIIEAIGKKADKATTLEGYGITNAYNKIYIDSTLNKYILLSASHQTIKGNITIEGNLIVKGEMASAGVSTDVGGGGSSTLAGLTDVLLGTLNNNDLLSWNGTVWTNVSRSSLTPNLDGYATKTYVTNALVPYATKDNVTSALGGYLPRSGGTIDGSLQVVSQNGEINLYNKNKGNTGWLFYNGGSEWKVTDNGWQHDYELIHSGNIGSQSVAYASNAGSASYAGTLNEYEVLDFVAQGAATIRGWHNWGNPHETSFANYTHGIVATSLDGSVYHYLGFANAEANPRVRSFSYGADSGWKTIAFVDDNVASATKLQTARSLWGNSFDGTSDVGGNFYYEGTTFIYLSTGFTTFGNTARTTYIDGNGISFNASGAENMRINASGNVTIGATTDNGAKLHVEGNIIAKNSLSLYESDNIYFHLSQTPWYATIQSTHVGTAYLPIAINGNGGNVGIGTYNPQAPLHVVGDAIITGDLASGSDIRFKDIINNTSLDINDIADAPLFTFKWNDREDNNTHLGTSAQYWESISPELVTGEDFKTLNYASLGVAMGISLAKKAMNHEERIKVLEEENKALKQEIKRMQYGS